MMKMTITRFSSFLALIATILSLILIPANAQNSSTTVSGKLYEFDEKSEYEISSSTNYEVTSDENTYGKFLLLGNIRETKRGSIPSYELIDGELDLTYKYTDTLINADLDSWHLYSDNTNTIDGIDIAEDIQKGTIWLQTSMDGLNWSDAVCLSNVFATTPICSDPVYTAKDIELINGCYYKLVVAYELRIRTETGNFLFVDTDKYTHKKIAEVYEFYAYMKSDSSETVDYSQTYNLGSKVCAKEFDGYYGTVGIDKNNIHYGWDLGNFFVSGYTDKRIDSEGNVVFLKNVGDKVTLWFNLSQDIDALNGNRKLTITADSEGYDRYFETPKTNFGKGALIIRYTDHNNNKSTPQIYTDYLEANTSFGANTKVQLFEEGDYEIALDYEVTHEGVFNIKRHYRIFFEFKVRNGNCMVYPFDILTGTELSDRSITENGFRLDLAKSRYLNITVERKVLKDSADGLVQDTRFNGPAKDGAEYTAEGIYTIKVKNVYTEQTTTKDIYVGTNSVLKAHMVTEMPIHEINNLVANGASIMEDGTIKLAEKVIESEPVTDTTQATTSPPIVTEEPAEAETVVAVVRTNDDYIAISPMVTTLVVGTMVIAGVFVIIISLKKSGKKDHIAPSCDKGDVEQ